MTVPAEYAHLTLREILRLFTGPGALPCPPELLEWREIAEAFEALRQQRIDARKLS